MDSKLLNHIRFALKEGASSIFTATVETDRILAIFGNMDPNAPELREVLTKLRDQAVSFKEIVEMVEKELNNKNL